MGASLKRFYGLKKDLIDELKTALEQKALTLHYQPIVNLQTGETVGWEALSRWWRNDEMIPPARFLPYLMGSDLEKEWLKQQLAIIRQDMAKLPRPHFISLNLSEIALAYPDLPEMIREHLWDLSRLVIEVTEEVLIPANSPTWKNLVQLRKQNEKLAVDDFGTGYSSFLRLLGCCQSLFSFLKLDWHLVNGCATSYTQQVLIEAILGVSAKLGFAAIAEGIESADDLAYLAGIGCEYGQGFYFAEPQPIEQILRGLGRG